jgi:hypothetical protein
MDLPEIVELKGYTPKPGDVLFVKVHSAITPEVADHLKKTFERAIPGVTIVVHNLIIDRVESLDPQR